VRTLSESAPASSSMHTRGSKKVARVK
jgi:hypothetical protein